MDERRRRAAFWPRLAFVEMLAERERSLRGRATITADEYRRRGFGGDALRRLLERVKERARAQSIGHVSLSLPSTHDCARICASRSIAWRTCSCRCMLR